MTRNGNGATVTAREETALSIREESSRELSTAREAAMAQHEVQSAITVAIKFPRNEDEAFGRLIKACNRSTFADKAIYSFPRGGKNIEGPSSHLAREAARVWGNIRYGFDIVRDDDENIHLRGWAWDMQTNTKATQDAHFSKLIQRKQKDGKTLWIKPDERDLRELINKHGAIAERNCVLKILPADLVEDAMTAANQTLETDASKDPDAARKKMIASFSGLNISVPDLEGYLGCPLKQISPEQITHLRQVYKSIADGHSSWSEYVQPSDKAPSGVKEEATMDDLLGDPAEKQFEHKEPVEEKPAATDLATVLAQEEELLKPFEQVWLPLEERLGHSADAAAVEKVRLKYSSMVNDPSKFIEAKPEGRKLADREINQVCDKRSAELSADSQ